MLTTQNTRDDFAGLPCTIAVLPVGAVEQHGHHLPVGTDILLAQSVAERLAERLDAYLLPPLAITSSIEHRKAKGTIYLRADTLALVIRDIVASLRDSGFDRLILANFHGGNWILKPTIRQLNRDFPDFRAILLQPDLPAAQLAAIFEHPAGDVHGGEFETSLMLHLHPQHVRPMPAGAETEKSFPPQPYLDYFDTTELTRHGHWGWPEAASAEKGRRAMDELVANALRTIEDIEAMARKISAPAPGEVKLRQLTSGDVPFATELNAIVGWNQTDKDWRGYLEFEPEGCFVAELGGRPVGTATTISYGDRVGWIGMVLVRPEGRRSGIGTRLLRHAIDYLQRRGTVCIKLDATPMGKKVYVPLGFADEYEVTRYEGTALADVAKPDPALQPFGPADVTAVAAFDRTAFGASREAVLQSMIRRNPEFCHVAREGSKIRGYVIAREGRQAVQLGPWLADDPATAEQLMRAVFHRVGGRRIFVDVPNPNSAGCALVEKYGFAVQRGFTRMHLGENLNPGSPSDVYGTSGAEKG
ncbi:MAG: GNAT family N-acetyltransferase [Opitutaceae bacterium]|nr:GNAT family N-acetyltransferase [Opitutaceae bacterium]